MAYFCVGCKVQYGVNKAHFSASFFAAMFSLGILISLSFSRIIMWMVKQTKAKMLKILNPIHAASYVANFSGIWMAQCIELNWIGWVRNGTISFGVFCMCNNCNYYLFVLQSVNGCVKTHTYTCMRIKWQATNDSKNKTQEKEEKKIGWQRQRICYICFTHGDDSDMEESEREKEMKREGYTSIMPIQCAFHTYMTAHNIVYCEICSSRC